MPYASAFKLYWHMIMRESIEIALDAIDHLQGLYDGLWVAVDSRPDSDELFDRIQIFPHVVAYRQVFDDFGRYDAARQDVLSRLPADATYIGWSDADEFLVNPKPRIIRERLLSEMPDAVDVGIQYAYPIGGHIQGGIYYRTRIWKASAPRVWSRPCHEHPVPINGVDNPVVFNDVLFLHVKSDPNQYRADHHIELMEREILSGNIGWLFYQAREYKYKGDIETSYRKYLEYLKSGLEQDRERCVLELISLIDHIENKTDFRRKMIEDLKVILDMTPYDRHIIDAIRKLSWTESP